MGKKVKNPFIYQGYEGPEYFCDRIVETETLYQNMLNGRNVTLISPRRIGKTGLIKNTFEYIKKQDKGAFCLYIDIFPTTSQQDFVRMLATAVLEEMASRTATLRNRTLAFFSALRPVFSIDPLTGAPTVSVSIEPAHTETTLKSTFDYLHNLKNEVYIAIDEFQQITTYAETGTEALLRSFIQFVPNVHFIFSGSKFRLMSEMFASPQRPFFQSTELLDLQPLHESIYYDFVRQFFVARKGDFDREVFHQLYMQFDGYTWYVQAILNHLYEEHQSVGSMAQLNEAIVATLNSKASHYEMLVHFLTNNQYALLRAIAREGAVERPTSKDFIQRNELPAASSVQTALDVLLDKELVFQMKNTYVIYDRFLGLWLQRYVG